MAIYHISDFSYKEGRVKSDLSDEEQPSSKDRFISSLGARFFFFLLLLADTAWAVFSIVRMVLFLIVSLVLFKFPITRKFCQKAYLSLKRSLVCGLALFVALWSPALGVMFACSYFLMYDKAGIDEVVPAVLQDQFKEFMAS